MIACSGWPQAVESIGIAFAIVIFFVGWPRFRRARHNDGPND